MNNGELKKLALLHTQAEVLATALYIGSLSVNSECDRVKRFKELAEKASNRAERRYRAIKKAYSKSAVKDKAMPGQGFKLYDQASICSCE